MKEHLRDYEEIGELIGKYCFIPGEKETAFNFVRRKRGLSSPYLECVKDICRVSGHNEVARGMIRIYCDMRKIQDIELFRAHYVDKVSLKSIARNSAAVLSSENKKYRDNNDIESIRSGLNKRIENVQRDFAVFLSNVIPLWLGGSTPIVPEKLPCLGSKSVMRGNCKRCFFYEMGECRT